MKYAGTMDEQEGDRKWENRGGEILRRERAQERRGAYY